MQRRAPFNEAARDYKPATVSIILILFKPREHEPTGPWETFIFNFLIPLNKRIFVRCSSREFKYSLTLRNQTVSFIHLQS